MRTPLIGALITILLGAPAGARAEEAAEEEFAPCAAPEPTKFELVMPKQVPALDVSIIRRYFRRNMSKLKYCYEKQLLVKPDLAGTIKLVYTIEPSGQTTNVKVKGFDTEVDACITTVIDGIELPKPKDGATIQMAHEITVTRDDGTRVFDTDSAECKALPAALVTYATKLANAIDRPVADGEKAFLALLPATVKVHGKKLTRARIKKEIADVSVDGWLTLGGGPWHLAKYKGHFMLRRGFPPSPGLDTSEGHLGSTSIGNGVSAEPASELRFKKVKGAWRLVEVVRE